MNRFVTDECYIRASDGELFSYEEDYGGAGTLDEMFEKAKGVLVQWTGCYDKNRTPIYEGDILANDLIIPHDNDNIGIVYFAAGTYMIDGDGPFYDHFFSHSPDILDNHTVIGNKFENPELLKA